MTIAFHTAVLALGLFGIGAETVNFDKLPSGSVPPDWTTTVTHKGAPPYWAIAPDPSAPSRRHVFAQLSTEGARTRFPLAIFDKVICADGDLSVKFKILGGSSDKKAVRTAGLVWRYQDQNNYYLLHFSVDEHNIVPFRVRNGKAEAIPVMGAPIKDFGVNHDVRLNTWYVARVVFRGSHFKVWFGNRQLFESDDTSLPSPGKTGLWTKAGTVAYFDDFRIDKKS